MIDSGATHNFISEQYLATLHNAKKIDAAKMQVQLANQEQVMSLQVV